MTHVIDIECLSNLFTLTGYCRQEDKFYTFVIHKLQNDYIKLIAYLKQKDMILVGYNIESYDYPILFHLTNHYDEYVDLNGYELSQQIYLKSQEIISMDFSAIADWKKYHIVIDLYKIFHYDNKAKHTSLKALEIALNLPNVEDMPFDHTYWISSWDEINNILSYNKNDVIATNEFLKVAIGDTELPLYKGKNKIQLRMDIYKKYKLFGINYNDIKLGTELILQLYSRKFNIAAKDIRKMRTFRSKIDLKDCLPKWTEFKSKEFNKLVEKFKSTTIYNGELKNALDYSVIFNGIKLDYGTGGCHACIRPGIYKSDTETMILDLDADSLYPNLAINQGLYPEHLGPGFLDIYDGEIVSVRMNEKHKPKKERDFVIVEGFKLAANGFYGKTNSDDSYAYDPLYCLRTTISGQIMISMWIEKLVHSIENLKILQINTDGITIMFSRKDYDKVVNVTDNMTQITGLTYEFNEYDKMVIRDVNNYSSKYTVDGKLKHKGAFEIDKELHKDPSMRIIPIALEKYFFEGIPIITTLKSHKNIYDFCLRLKIVSGFKGIYRYINEEGQMIDKQLSKNIRYFISNQGGILLKEKNKSYTGVNVGNVVTIFNNYYELPMDEYNINYDFYLKECNKIINVIEESERLPLLF